MASFVIKMALRAQDGMIIMAQWQTTVMLKKMQLLPVVLVHIDDFKLIVKCHRLIEFSNIIIVCPDCTRSHIHKFISTSFSIFELCNYKSKRTARNKIVLYFYIISNIMFLIQSYGNNVNM